MISVSTYPSATTVNFIDFPSVPGNTYYLLKGTSKFKRFLFFYSQTNKTTYERTPVLKLFRFKDSPVLMTDLALKLALIILPSVVC